MVVPFEEPAKKKAGEKAAEEVFDNLEQPNPEAETENPSSENPAPEKPSTEKPSGVVMDNQLARAVDLLKGIKVYQGGRKTATP